MYFKDQLVESGKAITNNSTTQIDLDGSEIVNGIKMHFACAGTSNLQADALRTLIEHITKVVITGDSDDELCSLTGDELAAAWFYDQHQPPDMYQAFYGYKTNRVQLNLNFGEKFQDPNMGVDLSQWENIDLDITVDDISTQYNSTGLTCRVSKVQMMNMLTPPRHWIRKIEMFDRKPSAANQEVNYSIAKGMKLKGLMFLIDSDLAAATNVPTNYPNTDSNEFTLTLKNDEIKIYDKAQVKSIWRDMAAKYGIVTTHGRMGLVTTIAIDTLLGYCQSITASAAEEGTGADTTVPSFAESNSRYVLPKFAGTADHYSVICGFIKSKWKPTTADHAFRLTKLQLMENA
jgi:hypothetical protein